MERDAHRATPLILTGSRGRDRVPRALLANIGAEGRLYAGALAAVAVGGMGPPALVFRR